MTLPFRAGKMSRVAFASALLRHDPRLLSDYLRWRYVGQEDPENQPPSQRFPPSTPAVSMEAARQSLVERIGGWEEGAALQQVRAGVPRAVAGTGVEFQMAGDTSLGELLYGLVRALRPRLAVETGVATGVTSAYVLAALSDNGSGELHSIDLPTRRFISAGYVGVAVPGALRSRWHYHWGPARRLLPPILARHRGALQLFIHDSDHSYSNMRWELEQGWRALAPGGWLAADDAELHTALDDVAAAVGSEPLYVRQQAKPGWTGLLRKPDGSGASQAP